MSHGIAFRSFFATLTLSLIIGASAVAEDRQAALIKQVDELFASCNRPDVPGCAVGIIQDGALIYSKGFGAAHLDYEAPNTPTTIFEIASASKGFTSACIAILLDEGKLQPDDDVRRLIPELQLTQAVRIRDMLRCESGLWDHFHILPLIGLDNVPNHASYSKADLLTVLSGQKRLPFEPGTDWQYGSSDFFLLGIVVERITGQTMAQFAKQRLFQPLGMTRTYYEEDAGLAVKNRAVGHWKRDEGWSSRGPKANSPWRLWQTNGYVAGGGGVRTCIEDLYRFDQGLYGDVLPRGTYLNDFLTHGMVLGNRFCIDADAYKKREHAHAENTPAGQYRGLKRVQFTGGFWGMSTCISRFPKQKFTVICLSNSSEVSPFAKTREIADLFLADQMKPLPIQPEAEPQFVKLDSATLATFTGAFRGTGNSPVWRTEVRDGELMLVDHLEHAFVLKPLSATLFKPVGETPFYSSARFEFARDDMSETTGFTLFSRENGFYEEYRFHRVELVQIAADELPQYAGTYASDELAPTYEFRVEDTALWLRVNGRRWEKLRPTVRDEFTPAHIDPHDQRFIRFSRNAAGEVDGFSIGLWRVRGVRFEKRPPVLTQTD